MIADSDNALAIAAQFIAANINAILKDEFYPHPTLSFQPPSLLHRGQRWVTKV